MAKDPKKRREIDVIPLKPPIKEPHKVPASPKREKVPANER